jgi:hypothetical protein
VLSGAVRSLVADPSHLRKREAGAPPELILCASLVSPRVRQGRGGEGGEGASGEIWEGAICSTIGGHRQRTAAAASWREATGAIEGRGTRFSLTGGDGIERGYAGREKSTRQTPPARA